jgi:cellulose synthase/poly-beta-1,6-N-acetylglucosamine synthase-like glycosyltransferase
VRDEAPYLAEALASLSAQTLEELEVVVVDDGSTDESAEIAEAHAERDRRFRVLMQPRAGLVAALERARADARGEFLARMDGDDVALPKRLELQLTAMQDEGLDACGGRIEYFPRATEGAQRYAAWINSLVTVEDAARDVFVECPLPHPTLVVRREALERAGGYEDRGWPEDYDLLLRLWACKARFRNVDETVLRWRDHPGRLSRTEPRYSLDAFLRCKVHHLRRTLLRSRRGVLVWGAGPVGKSFGRALRDELRGFVEVDPRKLGRTIYGVPVVQAEDAPRFEDALWLGAVAGDEARTRIREVVADQGRREGVDFVAVA